MRVCMCETLDCIHTGVLYLKIIILMLIFQVRITRCFSCRVYDKQFS